MSKYRTLASLGLSCQSAHQLARIADQEDALTFSKGPFDWLICPPASLVNWLDAGLPGFERDELHLHRGKVYWSRFDFWFWHGFHVKNGERKTIDIDAAFDREREKLAYQKRVFSNLSPQTTIFLISNTQNNLSTDVFLSHETERFHFHPENLANVQRSLSRYFDMPAKLFCISRADRWSGNRNIEIPHTAIKFQQTETSEWKGDDAQWTAGFNSFDLK